MTASSLENLYGIRKVSGSSLTTFAVGGEIKNFVEIHTVKELISLTQSLRSEGAKYRIIGGGSNLLIDDHGIDDYVIKLGKEFSSIEAKSNNLFFVKAATSLMTLSRKLSEMGFSGLEFAGGIPASLGGAVFMNAGAHGEDMSQILYSVELLTKEGEILSLSRKELNFSYRTSDLPKDSIVLGASISLVTSTKEDTSRLRTEYLSERKKRQPLTVPSAGSVFRNPMPEKSAGFLIEHCGLKGISEGGAKISELHANWIVNPKREAKSDDVLRLIDRCKKEVQNRYSIELEEEIIYWSKEL